MLHSWMALRRARTWLRIISLAGALLVCGTVGAQAELRISGNRDALLIQARDAPLKQVLEALRKSFKLQYRGTAGLERTITGTYSGSVRDVVSRLLANHDYIIRSSLQGMDVVILNAAKAVRTANDRGPPASRPLPLANRAGSSSQTNATWQDGDGNLIRPPSASLTVFAGANAAATWRDGDGNLIAPPPGH